MNNSLDARIEVARGELVIGQLVVPMTPEGAAGEWRLGGAAGPVLRTLRYDERTRLAAMATTSADPRASLAAAVARVSTVSEGVADPVVHAVAALLVSGAGAPGVPFSEALLRVGRAGGWDLAQIVDAPAETIDRLALSLGAAPVDAGWNRLVFDDGSGGATPAAVRDALADNLLSRVDAPPVSQGDVLPNPDAPFSPREALTPIWEARSAGAEAPAASAAAHAPADAGAPPVRVERRKAMAVVSGRWSRAAASTPAEPYAASVSSSSRALHTSHAAQRDERDALPRNAADARTSPVGVAAVASGSSTAVRSRRVHAGNSPMRSVRPDSLGLAAVWSERPESLRSSSGEMPARWTPGLLRTGAAQTREMRVPAPPADDISADLADAIASRLQDEADLRGIE